MTSLGKRPFPLLVAAVSLASVLCVPTELLGQCRNDLRNVKLVEVALAGRAAITGDSLLEIDSASLSPIICEPSAFTRLTAKLVAARALLRVAPPKAVRDTLSPPHSPRKTWTVIGVACSDENECVVEAIVDALNGGAVEGYTLVRQDRWRLFRLVVSQLYFY